MVLEYVEGETLTDETVAMGDRGPRESPKRCGRSHAGPRFRTDFDMFRTAERWLRMCDEREIPDPRGTPGTNGPGASGGPGARCPRDEFGPQPQRSEQVTTSSTMDGGCGLSTSSTAGTTTRATTSPTSRARRSSTTIGGRCSARHISAWPTPRCSPGCACTRRLRTSGGPSGPRSNFESHRARSTLRGLSGRTQIRPAPCWTPRSSPARCTRRPGAASRTDDRTRPATSVVPVWVGIV